MADLESLSNKQLHAKCLEVSLDIPVTDSSRNVIIRKLKKLLAGGSTTSPHGVQKNKHRVVGHSSKVTVNANRQRKQPSPGILKTRREELASSKTNASKEEVTSTTSKDIDSKPPQRKTHSIPMQVETRNSASTSSSVDIKLKHKLNVPIKPLTKSKKSQSLLRFALSQSKLTTTSYNEHKTINLNALPPLGAQPCASPSDLKHSGATDRWQLPKSLASLSRSGVMTTSYRQEFAPTPKLNRTVC